MTTIKLLNYNCGVFNNTKQYLTLSNDSLDLYNVLTKNNFSKHYFLYDRTQSIKHFLPIDQFYCPLPKYKKISDSFYDISKKRCEDLLSIGKPINVYWSGGIDSTFVLMMLYHLANDKQQIKVFGTYHSIIESGSFFDKHIKDRMQYTIKVNVLKNFMDDTDSILVNGSMSNQLFIPGLKYNGNRDSILIFKDGFNIYNCFDEDYKKVLTEECVEFLYESINNSPKQIHTLQDLRWYINFNFTWYNVLTTPLIALNPSMCSKIFSFFNTEEFQLWSICNNDPATIVGDYSDERWQIRQIIKELTNDVEYATMKKKHASVISPSPNNWLYLFNNYTNEYYENSN